MGRQSRAKREKRSRRPARRGSLLRHRGGLVAGGVVLAAVGLLLFLGRVGPGPSSLSAGDRAPAFALPATDGGTVSLADLRDGNALLYFSEGVGCDPCFTQMVELEGHRDHLEELDVSLVPVMTNPGPMVAQEARRFGIRTPVLIDSSKRVSVAYDVLGRGHHADLPGHSFILVDQAGIVRWRGDYPSMYVSAGELLGALRSSLPA